MALPRDVELVKQKMEQAQDALVRYAKANPNDLELQRELIQHLRAATQQFIERIERLAASLPKTS